MNQLSNILSKLAGGPEGARIQNFCTNLDPETWMEKYEEVANFKRWTDEDKVSYLGCYLDGGAFSWYKEEMRINDRPSWTYLRFTFLDVFRKHEYTDGARDRMQNRKQEPDEDVINYYFEKLALCRKVDNNMPQREIAGHIYQTLNPDIKSHIFARDCEDLAIMFAKLKEIETKIEEEKTNGNELFGTPQKYQ